MKKVLSIIIILFPYLLGLLAYGLLKEISLDGGNWLIYLILISVLVMVFLIIYIMMLFSMFFKWDIKTSILSNLLIKIAYIPVYCILFLLSALMGNPFTFFLMPIPLMISFIFMVNINALELNSKYSYVYNIKEDKVMYEKDSRKEVKVASLTKIMTAIIAIENNDNLDKEVIMN